MGNEGPVRINNLELLRSRFARQHLAPAIPFTLKLEDAVQEAVARRRAERSDQRARPQCPFGYQAVNHGLIGLLSSEQHRPSRALPLVVLRSRQPPSVKGKPFSG